MDTGRYLYGILQLMHSLIPGDRTFIVDCDQSRMAALESIRKLRRPLPSSGWSFDRRCK